jgi:hypothetical protein
MCISLAFGSLNRHSHNLQLKLITLPEKIMTIYVTLRNWVQLNSNTKKVFHMMCWKVLLPQVHITRLTIFMWVLEDSTSSGQDWRISQSVQHTVICYPGCLTSNSLKSYWPNKSSILSSLSVTLISQNPPCPLNHFNIHWTYFSHPDNGNIKFLKKHQNKPVLTQYNNPEDYHLPSSASNYKR